MKFIACVLSLLLAACANERQSAGEQEFDYVFNAPLFHCVYANGYGCEESIWSEGTRGRDCNQVNFEGTLGDGPCPRTNCVGVCKSNDFYTYSGGKWKKIYYQGNDSSNSSYCYDQPGLPAGSTEYLPDCD